MLGVSISWAPSRVLLGVLLGRFETVAVQIEFDDNAVMHEPVDGRSS
jgi:hypothetical protein